MAAFNKFNAFVADIGLKKHQLNTDTLKMMLTDVAPVATNAVLADLTEITAQNGYPAGGVALSVTSYSQSGGTAKLGITTQPVITASGGTIGPFRYAVIYNSTAAGGPLIGWHDRGVETTLQNGDSFTDALDTTNGILTIA